MRIEITGRCFPMDGDTWLQKYRQKLSDLNTAAALETLGVQCDGTVDKILERMKMLDGVRPNCLSAVDKAAFEIIGQCMDAVRKRRAEGKLGLID